MTRTPVLTRREALLLSATAGIAAVTPSTLLASESIKTGVHQETGTVSTPRSAIAKTQYGLVRGFLAGGVFTFKGVPYGQNAGGENRWLPLKPPTPWTHEYPAFTYGANCPQSLPPWTAIEQTFMQDWDDGWLSEDMLKLNIWTPSLSGCRPVMVYFHGGGFSFGSSYELPSHEGAQMARHHDVVQVSVNHRLNILGFFDASEIGGSAYEDSANVGMTDLVDSLKWVRENIANFGGDPDRVMIYGQSGGGSKVTTLLGMPSASGLIHRAAAQSGGGGNIPMREQQREVARVMMKDLGLAANDIGALQRMDWPRLIAAGNAAITKVNPPGPTFFGPGLAGHPRAGWTPSVDDEVVTLYQVGILTEKLFGNLRFLVLYLLAGVFGNVAGLYLHPNVISAGASGAVFGVYGALLAFLLKEPNVIPKENALAIAKSAGVFLLFNIIYGLSKSEVDMTAHIAGLAAGFVAGWFLASPLLPAAQHIQPLRALTVATGGTLLASVFLMAAPKTQMHLSELSRQVITGKSVPVGNGGKIIYSGTATVEDAENLGKVLREQYFFSNQGNVILFSKGPAGPSITFPLKSQRTNGVPSVIGPTPTPTNAVPLWDDPNTILNFERLGVLVAPFVGGPPLEVRLTDGKGDLKQVLHVEYRSRAVSAHDRVWYSGIASEADAKVLGKTLQSLGYFHDTGSLVLLKKNAGATDLSLIVKDGVWNDQRLVAGFQTLGVKIADAIGSHPLALHLLDGTHQEKKLLTIP